MLELIDLRRRFGDVVALDGVSFSVPEGSIVGFVGPNGAGKTTAMRIVLGVLEPDEGQVRWRGQPVEAVTRRRFGYMPEERGLYPKMRVLEQLVYLARLHGLSATDAHRQARETMEVLGVDGRADDRVESSVPGQSAAGAARGGARARARRAGAGRAVLGLGPGGGGRPGRRCCVARP